MSTSVFVCLSVYPRAYLRSHTRDLYQNFCACCLWPWLGPPTKSLRKGAVLWFSSPLTMHCNAFTAKGFTAKGIIPHRPRRGDGSLQRGRSVIYDCLACICVEQLGGFRLPFISLGSLLVLVGFVSYFVLPPQNGKSPRDYRIIVVD